MKKQLVALLLLAGITSLDPTKGAPAKRYKSAKGPDEVVEPLSGPTQLEQNVYTRTYREMSAKWFKDRLKKSKVLLKNPPKNKDAPLEEMEMSMVELVPLAQIKWRVRFEGKGTDLFGNEDSRYFHVQWLQEPELDNSDFAFIVKNASDCLKWPTGLLVGASYLYTEDEETRRILSLLKKGDLIYIKVQVYLLGNINHQLDPDEIAKLPLNRVAREAVNKPHTKTRDDLIAVHYSIEVPPSKADNKQ